MSQSVTSRASSTDIYTGTGTLTVVASQTASTTNQLLTLTAEQRDDMAMKELVHGRTAMLAFAGVVTQAGREGRGCLR